MHHKTCRQAPLGAALRAAASIALVVVLLASAGAKALSSGRAYELVSPPDKSGGDVMAFAGQTRSALDGNAIGFVSLRGFGDVAGTGVTVDYLAERSAEASPGSNGWATHALTPPQDTNSVRSLGAGSQAGYVGGFSTDLQQGVFYATSPVGSSPYVEDVPNLYLRTDLRTPGAGAYSLVTACPLCGETGSSLAALPGTPATARFLLPRLADASSDFRHVIFESAFNLTADAPPQPPLCLSSFFAAPAFCHLRLYDWDHGALRLAGILPDGSAADVSIAGQGARNDHLTTHTISDGSDGHSRIFFTEPTDASGNVNGFAGAIAGNLFVRVDNTTTAQLNASERTSGDDAYAPATFLDATPDGRRAYFMTAQALTDDAPVDTDQKIYMYDTTKPASAPDKLTLLNVDSEPQDGADARGLVGTSRDGRYVYMIVIGQLVRGGPLGDAHLYLWHDGAISEVSHLGNGDTLFENMTSAPAWELELRQARVSPDGKHLLFIDLSAPPRYDPATCGTFGCRELYVYSADTGRVVCASCDPGGAPPTSHVTDVAVGEAGVTWHETHAMSDDGRYVFFNTADALVPEDVNHQRDAYEYDTTTGRVSLLSSGVSPSESVFLDASADGRNAFFVTRDQLVGWDRDDAYDLYDARVGGGFPEPPTAPPACAGEECQGSPSAGPSAPPVSTTGYRGAGNVRGVLRARRSRTCARGHATGRTRGKRRCVKSKRRRHHRASAKRAGSARRAA